MSLRKSTSCRASFYFDISFPLLWYLLLWCSCNQILKTFLGLFQEMEEDMARYLPASSPELSMFNWQVTLLTIAPSRRYGALLVGEINKKKIRSDNGLISLVQKGK